MLLNSVYTKTLRDRWLGVAIGTLSIGLMVAMGVATYRSLDEVIAELIRSYPEALLSMMGATPELLAGGATRFVLAEMTNFLAPLVLAGIAISVGTSTIAGEERLGTLGLLLANPRSRTAVLMSKLASLVTLMVSGGLLMWGATEAGAAAAGVASGTARVGAASVHVAAAALSFGALSLCIGAWTGNATAATGITTGALIVSFLGAGLFPLIEGAADVARIFPWYYIAAAEPLQHGVDWGHVAILLAASSILSGLAVVGVNRRDLRSGAAATLLDQLRRSARLARLSELISGRAQVANTAARTFSESRGVAVIVAYVMFLTALLIGLLFNALSDTLGNFADAIPEALVALFGDGDVSTPEGWYQLEVFSFVVPGGMIVVAIMMGARAIGGEQDNSTMDLLLANPITRPRLVAEKGIAMVLAMLVLGVTAFAGTVAGSLLGGLGMSAANVAAASAQSAALAVVFGATTMLAGAATGRSRPAALAGAAIALAAYVANSFLRVDPRVADWARLSPFYYYMDNDALVNGISWANVGVLAAAAVVLLVLCAIVFERRDVRS